MGKFFFTIIVISLISSCNSGVEQSEYDKLKAELADCQKTVVELQNTPLVRFSKGQEYLSKNDIINAKKEFNELIKKFSESEEAKKAEVLIAEIDKKEREKKEAEERKRTLGFKVLKENSTVSVGDVTVKFNSISTADDFVFDRYDDSWRYRSAERGEIFVLASVSVTSKVKDPELPPIAVYKVENGTLNLINTLEYRFHRWEDYASYLGNNADYANDFAHTPTIRFSSGLSISKDDLNKNALFVVIKKENCFYRSTDRFANPPVSYTSGGCNLKPTLTVDDFDSSYVLVKVFNKNKL